MSPNQSRPKVDSSYYPSTTGEILHRTGAVVVGGAGFLALQGLAMGIAVADVGAQLLHRAVEHFRPTQD